MIRVLLLARKDLAIFLTDPVAIGLAFIVPLVMIMVFGFVFGGAGEDPISELRVLAVNRDEGPGGSRLIAALDRMDELDMRTRLRNDTTAVDSVKAYQLVRDGAFSVALIIPEDFSASVKSGILKAYVLEDPRDPVTAGVLVGLLQKQSFETFPMLMPTAMMSGLMEVEPLPASAFNKDLRRALEKNFDVRFPDSIRGFADLIPEDMMFGDTAATADTGAFSMGEMFDKVNRITREQVVGQDVVNPGIAQSTAGTAVMFMLFGVGAIAASLLREMHTGTAQRLLLSGARSGEILLSKSMYAVIMGTIQLTIMMLYGWLIFDLQVFENPEALLLMIVVTATAMSGVGLLISALARTEEQAAGLQVVIILSMSAIGGAMVPSFLIPEFIRTIAWVTPVHWAMQGFTDIFWRQNGIAGILTELAVLSGMAVLMIGVAVAVFRRRLATELG